MSVRKTATKVLANLFNVLSNADRVRIIEELYVKECDVQTLSELVEISQSRVSQQLSLLKLNNIVSDKRDGRRVIYSLNDPDLALWILDGLKIIEKDLTDNNELREKLEQARAKWTSSQPD